jgi:hypothetical protein
VTESINIFSQQFPVIQKLTSDSTTLTSYKGMEGIIPPHEWKEKQAGEAELAETVRTFSGNLLAFSSPVLLTGLKLNCIQTTM